MPMCAARNPFPTQNQTVSEVSLGKRSARKRFQIAFERSGFFSLAESNGHLQDPMPEFRGVRDFALVVFGESGSQVIGQANVVMFRP